MKDVMIIYAEHLAERGLPLHDESSAVDRQRFEDFKGGFVAGVGEALLEVGGHARPPLQVCRMELRSAVLIHGRN